MTTTTKPRRSSKSGDPKADQAAADAAIAAENAKITPQPEPEQPAPGPSDPPDDHGGPSSDTRDREDQDQEDGEDERDGEDGEDEPEPSQPTAQLNIGRFPYWMHRPRIIAPDGTVHTCQHRDGHEKIKAAMACARSLGSEAGLTVPAADPSWPEGGPGEPVS